MRFGPSYCISVIATLTTSFAAFAAAPEIGLPAVASTAQEQTDEAAWNRFGTTSARSSDLRLRGLFSVDGFDRGGTGSVLTERVR